MAAPPEAEEADAQQQLVGDRIEDAAEHRLPAIAFGQEAVEDIGRAGHQRQPEGLGKSFFGKQPQQRQGHHHPRNGDGIGDLRWGHCRMKRATPPVAGSESGSNTLPVATMGMKPRKPRVRSSCRRNVPGTGLDHGHLAHDGERLQVAHQAEEIALGVHARDVDQLRAGNAGVERNGIALGDRVGALVHAGRDHAARVDCRRRTSAPIRCRPGSAASQRPSPAACDRPCRPVACRCDSDWSATSSAGPFSAQMELTAACSTAVPAGSR